MIEADTEPYAKAKTALLTSPILSLRRLEIEKHGESLVLTGRVHTFYEKQRAQELVRTAAGGCQLVNSIRVD